MSENFRDWKKNNFSVTTLALFSIAIEEESQSSVQ